MVRPRTAARDDVSMGGGLGDSSHSGDRFDSTSYDGDCEDKTSPIYKELQRGPAKTIVGIIGGDGICASYAYIASLNAADQAQFKSKFERYTQVGYLKSPDEMRILSEGADVTVRVHEIKTRNGHRLFGVQEGSRFVASHGARKPKRKAVNGHVQRARSAYEEAKSREEARRKQ